MPPPSPGPKPAPLPDPTPPPEPDPMPPPDPGPFDGGPILASGSPQTGILLFGSWTSGGPIRVGSISNLGFGLFTTAAGGTNCLAANLGACPLLAGNGDRSPPPPPPCIVLGFGLASGIYGAMSGATRCATSFIFTWTVLFESTVNSKRTTVLWIASDINPDSFLR